LSIELDSVAAGIEVTSETRMIGIRQIEVDFDVDAGGSYTPGQVTAGGLTVLDDTLINGGTTLKIQVTGSANQGVYAVDIAGSIGGLWGDTDCMLRSLEGDVNNDGVFSLMDAAEIKSKVGVPVVPDNIRLDVNLDGVITLDDIPMSYPSP
jgi:hypothetical protein